MTITNSSTRLAAIVAGVAVAAGLIGAVAIAPAQAAALSSTQVQAIVNLLQSFGADAATIANVTAALNGQATPGTGSGSGSAGACPALARDLQQGSSGSDVMALQAFLNASADTRVSASGAGSPGMETSTFGPATKAAVIKFQVKYMITPAAGYVGPVTRAKIASVCGGTSGGGSTGGNTGGLQGGEGQLTDIDNISGEVEDEVQEGNEENVFGVEMTAEDSDVMIERVDVDFTLEDADTTQSDNLDDYITEVSIILDGKVLATMDVDEADENDEATGDFTAAADGNNVFSFRFTGLKGVIEEDEAGDLFVAVTAVNNIDSTDATADWYVLIPDDGIRAVDAAGISETYVAASELDEETFSVVAADAGDLDLAASESDNPDRIISVSADTDTDGEEVMVFTLESNTSDNTVTEIQVDFATTTSTSTLFSTVISQVHLYDGNTRLASADIDGSLATDESATFDDLDIEIGEDEEMELRVVADFNDEADEREGFQFNVTVDASEIEAEDAEGDSVTVSGDVTGGNIELRTSGIEVEFVSATETVSTGVNAGDPDLARLTIVFDITAVGDEDVYIDADMATAGAVAAVGTDGLFWATTSQSSTGTTTSGTYAYGTPILTASGSTSDDDTSGSDLDFFIESGETRRFTFEVTIPAGDDNKAVGARITGIKWGTTDADDNMDNLYTFDIDDLKTDTVTGLYIR